MSIDSLAVGMPMEAQIAMLLKRATKFFNRIDRLFDEIAPAVPNADAHVSAVKNKLRKGDYYKYDVTDKKKYLRQIDFDLLALDLSEKCYGFRSIELLPQKIRDDISYEIAKQTDERLELLKREHIRDLEKRNDLPQISGNWRKQPYPTRTYEHLTNYVPASLTASFSGLISTNTNDNPENKNSLELKQLDTDLEGYLGQPYNYNDGELTEEWMSSFQDVAAPSSTGVVSSSSSAKGAGKGAGKASKKKAAAAAAATSAPTSKAKSSRGGVGTNAASRVEDNIIRPTLDDVIRIQLENVMETMRIQVQDRVCTENKILTSVPPVDIGEVLKEMPVWGVDSYTRRMIEIAIEDNSAVYKAMSRLPDIVDTADTTTPYETSGIAAPVMEVDPVGIAMSDSDVSRSTTVAVVTPTSSEVTATSLSVPPLVPASAPTEPSVRGARLCNESIIYFIESVALPAINTVPSSDAHDMRVVMRAVLNQCDVSNPHRLIRYYRSFVADFAAAVLLGIEQYGLERFRIHPKGTGVVVCEPVLHSDRNLNTVDCVGIPPHVVICPYLGELHLPYRWCEKLDVVEQAQQMYNLKPTLPDFYNILLERPRQDKKGYGLLYVDASQRANMGSSCSHSCNANCTSNVVSRNGKLCIVLTTNRWIYPGEELSMDYYSVTNSEVEWRASICLCGSKNCRGTFLHYAAQDDLQQVLTRNCGILWRYATLLRACSLVPLSSLDKKFLSEHGMGEAVFGFNSTRRREDALLAAALSAAGRGSLSDDDSNKMNTESSKRLVAGSHSDVDDVNGDVGSHSYDYAGIPDWVLKYASDNLRFIEYERKALPMALMRTNKQSLFGANEGSNAPGTLPYTFTEADIEARSVMEQRIQSFVSCYSMIMQVIDAQPRPDMTASIKEQIEGEGVAENSSKVSSFPSSLFPLKPLPVSDAIVRVHEVLATIPMLLDKYIVGFYEGRATADVQSVQSFVIPVAFPVAESKKKSLNKKGAAATSSGSLGTLMTTSAATAPVVPLHPEVNSTEAVVHTSRVIMELYQLLGIDNRKYAPPFSPSPRSAAKSSIDASVDLTVVSVDSVTATAVVKSEKVLVSPMKAMVDSHATTQPEESTKVEKVPAVGDVEEGPEESAPFVLPKGFAAMRQLVLKVRSLVESIVKYSTTEARLLLLCDMLVLWANTSHYSMVRAYEPVQSEPIRVVARELGTNISRSKLMSAAQAKETQMSRAERASQRASAAVAAREEEILQEVIQASLADVNAGSAMEVEADERTSPVTDKTAGNLASVPSATTLAPDNTAAAVAPLSAILDANELVFVGHKSYGKYFSFWQLMQWFNAGTDDKVTESDLFGCVQLPLPGACFGPTSGSVNKQATTQHSGKDKDKGHSSSYYSVKSPQRKALLQLINSERLQINPWPTVLKECFNGLYGSVSDLPASFRQQQQQQAEHDDSASTTASGTTMLLQLDWYQHAIMGSPLLDISLGQMDALLRVRQDFGTALLAVESSGTGGAPVVDEKVDIFAKLQSRNDQNASNNHANSQFDSVLPPELPAQWIQCDLCKKWRRIAWHIDHNIEQERETWTCADNTWDPEKAFCEAELDWFDAESESTLNVGNAGGGEGELACGSTDIADYKLGSWYDVFCNRNLLYYEAKVVGHKQPRAPAGSTELPLPQVQFNFKGWGKRFGEWIEVGSERIQQHNLFTTPTETGNAVTITKIQMEWQATNGTLSSNSVGVLAGQEKVFANSKKKKASKSATTATGNNSSNSGAKSNKKQKTK